MILMDYCSFFLTAEEIGGSATGCEVVGSSFSNDTFSQCLGKRNNVVESIFSKCGSWHPKTFYVPKMIDLV